MTTPLHEVPATPTQSALWVAGRLQPESTAYNLPVAAVVEGPLDVARLRHAVDALVRRHDALRTVFTDRDGRVMQRVLPIANVEWKITREDAPAPSESELRRRVEDHVGRVFDVEAGPLIRGAVWTWSGDVHAVVLVLHHIVADHVAMGHLLRELAALYAGEHPGPDPEVQFPDYAGWLDEHVLPAAEEPGLKEWRVLLDGFSGVLELPTDRPRTFTGAGAGGELRFSVGTAVATRARALGRAEGVSLFEVLLAAMEVFLHKHTNQQDIVVGTPFSHRDGEPHLDRVVGCLINTVPIPVTVRPEDDFRMVLRRSHEVVRTARDNQTVPLMSIVRSTGGRRDPSVHPLFQVGLALQDPPEKLHLPGLRTRELVVHNGAAAYDLHAWLWEEGEEVSGLFWYDACLFDESTVERFATRYTALLERLLDDPERALARQSAATEREVALCSAWNDTAREWTAEPSTIWHAVRDAGERQPSEPAVLVGADALTYVELNERSDRISRSLMSRGVKPGDIVGVAMGRDRDLIPTLLGVMGAGAAYLPLDPEYPSDRLSYMIESCDVALVICSDDACGKPVELGVERVPVAELLDATAGDAVPPGPRPEDLMYVIYTSGSTGRPKGVMVPHRAVTNLLLSMRERPGLAREDRLLAVTTLSFDIAVLELFLPLLVGASVVLATPEQVRDGRALAELLEQHEVRVMQGTPSLWRSLIDGGWEGDRQLKALCGGETLPASLAEQLLERVGELWNLYGPTETTVWSTVAEVKRGGPITIGRPIHNTTCHVLDPDGNHQPVGVPGELWIAGRGVTRGYLGGGQRTAGRFVDDPAVAGGRRYRTGDLVRYGADGRLVHLGRLDHQVKVNGHRIELGEIETVLGGHPGVHTCVAVATGGPGTAARLAAFFVASGLPPTGSELRSHLRHVLPDYMVPGIITQLDALPLTPNGKVDRSALPDPLATRRRSVAEPLSGPLEERVAAEWMRVLALQSVGGHDNFFELGGTSLLAIQVAARLQNEVGGRVDPRAMFFDNLRQFAASLDEREGESVAS